MCSKTLWITENREICVYYQADLCKVNRTTPPEDIPLINSLNQIPGFLLKPVDDFISYLDNSVMLRVRDVPRTS